MKKITSFLTTIIILTIAIVSCKNKVEGINQFQIGNSKGDAHVFVGEDINWTSTVYFKNKIKSVEVKLTSAHAGRWSFEKIYNEEFKGETEYRFNEVITLPPDLPVGEYEFTIQAIDSNGESDEKTIKVNVSVDSSRPFASTLDVGINAKKDNLHLESHISAPKKVQHIKVYIKQNALAKEYVFEGKNIAGEIDFTFHEHVDVSDFPPGNYEVILDITDMNGKSAQTKGSFQK